MKKVSIRKLQINPAVEIDEGLPFAITRYGKVIAYVVQEVPSDTPAQPLLSLPPKKEAIKKNITEKKSEKPFKMPDIWTKKYGK